MPSHRVGLTHGRLYAQTLDLPLNTQKLLHTDAFAYRCLYTQAPLHTDPFKHRHFYTKTLLPFLHRRFHTQTLLRTDAFTHRSFYTKILLHTGAFTHSCFYTQLLLLQSLHKVRPSTTSYYKACTKYVPVLHTTKLTKLAQSTSQYDFVLQDLHKVRPSTTSYYKICTKNVPVLLRTTKLEVLPSTTSYYKTCRKYFPVLLRTTELAQSTSQYYFILQSLHEVVLGRTLCKLCSKMK